MSRISTVVLAFVASVIVSMGLPHTAQAQKRVAFVVGIDKYDNLDVTRQLQRARDMRLRGQEMSRMGQHSHCRFGAGNHVTANRAQSLSRVNELRH